MHEPPQRLLRYGGHQPALRVELHGAFNNEHQLARHLHSLGGGWEAVAGGMLTLTVPAERASELKRLMYVEGLAPGVLPLEA